MKDSKIIIKTINSLVVRISGVSLGFLFTYVLTNELPIREAGVFLLGFSIITFVSVISRFGLDNTILRFIGSSKPEDSHFRSKVMTHSIYISLLFSLTLCLMIYINSEFISTSLFNKVELQATLKKISLCIPFLSFSVLMSFYFQARSSILISNFHLNIIVNLSATLIILLFEFDSSVEVANYFILSCIFSAISALIFLLVRDKFYLSFDSGIIKSLFRSSFPMLIVALMSQLVLWSGQILSGVWDSAEEVAKLAVAQRISLLISFILIAINFVTAPLYAKLYKNNDLTKIRHIAKQSTRVLIVISIVVFSFIYVFKLQILSIFGESYSDSTIYLLILSFGQLINSVTGSVGYLLSMTGHEKDQRNVGLLSGSTAVIACLLLCPIYGALGGALATASAIVIQNLSLVYMVKKRLGFNTLNIF